MVNLLGVFAVKLTNAASHLNEVFKPAVTYVFTKKVTFLESEILTAVTRRIPIFWDVMPCSPVEFYSCLGGKFCLLLQDGKYVKQTSMFASCLANIPSLKWRSFFPSKHW
jgi:hypothetical protein